MSNVHYAFAHATAPKAPLQAHDTAHARSQRPAPSSKPVAWWNRPITWGIVAMLLMLSFVGFMASGDSQASMPDTIMDVSDLDVVVPMSAYSPPVEQKPIVASQPGHVMVPSDAKFNGSPVTGVNNGNITVNNNWGTPEPQIVEKVTVVEKPVYIDRPVHIERERQPLVVHVTTVIGRDTNDECEELHRQHLRTVASWRANPLPR